jgi:hypothetical protein
MLAVLGVMETATNPLYSPFCARLERGPNLGERLQATQRDRDAGHGAGTLIVTWVDPH